MLSPQEQQWLEDVGAAELGTAPAAGVGVVSPSTSPSRTGHQWPGVETAGLGYSHAALHISLSSTNTQMPP